MTTKSHKKPQKAAESQDKPEKAAESLTSRQKRYLNEQEMVIRRISIDRLHKQAINIISREMKALMKASYYEPLNPVQIKALCDYTKLIRELKKEEDDELNEMSDEELQKLLK